MTLTTPNDNQPDWVNPELGLEEIYGLKLGQKIYINSSPGYIIHIQKVEDDLFFRIMLPNGASITSIYEAINTRNTPYPKEVTRYIGMDTKYLREGLHLWITTEYDDESRTSTSIHLDRKECKKLMEDIKERLF